MASGGPLAKPHEEDFERENESSDDDDDDDDDDEEADEAREITFYASTDHNLPEFLDLYKPSVVRGAYGVAWISVYGPNYDASESYREEKRKKREILLEAWEKLKDSGQRLNMTTVMNLAKDHNLLGGKWLFHTRRKHIDRAWGNVARAVSAGQCGKCAKVSPVFYPGENVHQFGKFHVVCVYNNDFSDRNSVMNLEDSLRKAGIKYNLFYKPDAFTYMNIYTGNEWNLRPTLYSSKYDIIQKCSRITCHFA